ncbi:23S rRNA (uracil(1939)-C(5))-methyltransferase RlmD [Gloeocapsa sp. PCC 73106]|uniref:23S rRNA (uracil(1939)-C(5))-methyltransferase RlmD n=1 Tax=Gloeocapsa sp. PCC 73106 TaxID=102232 RepID=UPI0002AC92C1|nr:23S rRNA (uracil(1939)-C(5))-methyltransferase RlmD [Gloeocapsa sp. PCC 73106]ELR96413.1 23S rRNA (uracil-5-)-methyltransferase RumA [Gloeocapsa sp. PCC 73106]
MAQGQLIELEIEDLNHQGEGVGRFDGCVVFVPDTVVGDRALVRIVHQKKQHRDGKLEKVLVPSPHRIRPHCIVADKCGGCQWQHIDYDYQTQIKRNQVQETLARVGGFDTITVAETLTQVDSLGYRNKATYPLGVSLTQQIQAGYYRKGTHKLINLNQCPVQDPRLNPLLEEVKEDIQQRGWSIDQHLKGTGQLRHLSLRIGRRTGEILLTLVTTTWNLPGILPQSQSWLERYPSLVGVALNLNQAKTNRIFGEQTRTIQGKPYLREIFAGLELHLRPETFFQVNTETAEALLQIIRERLHLQGTELLIDAYCGIGTFTLPLAQEIAQAIGIEVQASSVEQARLNATVNSITNATFYTGAVEALLPELPRADILLLDPPRKGCDRVVIETIRQTRPSRLVYISCQPATLARDLRLLCADDFYRLTFIQPADFFPQTPHVEVVAFLESSEFL